MIPVRLLPVTMAACSLFIFVKIAAVVQGFDRMDEVVIASAYAEEKEKEEAKADAEKADKKEEGEKKEKKKDAPKKGKKKTKEELAAEEAKKAEGGLFDKCQFNQIEVDLLQSLSSRREEIEKWADEMAMQEQVLKATEVQIDGKIKQMQSLKAEVQDLLKKYDTKEAVELKSLVKIYENMKPKDAARIMNEMEMEILLELIDMMSERKASLILAGMDAKKAKDLTIELAEKRRLKQRATAGAEGEE